MSHAELLQYAQECLILTMKVRLGNRALAFLGGITLEFYLMHGVFVELFGFNFLDISKSVIYIKNVPVYMAAVLACSVAAALLFRWFRREVTDLLLKKGPDGETGPPPPQQLPEKLRQRKKLSKKKRMVLKLLGWAVGMLLLCEFLLPILSGNENYRVMNGLEFHVPVGYTRTYTDARYAIWKYSEEGRNPGNLILDGDIRDNIARFSYSVEEVLAGYSWLEDAEIYVNPHGVRMVRGYTRYGDSVERRYYIEGPEHLTLMCMVVNDQYYNPDDCEQVLQQTADSVRWTH